VNETVRVGVDVASIAAVAASLDRYGSRYTRRLFTAGEVADSAGVPVVRASRLAARFAAKEAVLKVLRPGLDVPVWTDIEVRRELGGWCSLHLHGTARQAASAAGLGAWAVSMSHEAQVAVAVVVAVVVPPSGVKVSTFSVPPSTESDEWNTKSARY
jgi:holo-[acyl-carrier protein] synthase